MLDPHADHAQDQDVFNQLMQAVNGLNFPADRANILEQAEKNGASERLMEILHRLPLRHYDSPDELGQVLDQIL